MLQTTEICQNLQIKVLGVEEVADLLESSEELGRSDFGPFEAVRLKHQSLGEAVCITSHGGDHLVIHL